MSLATRAMARGPLNEWLADERRCGFSPRFVGWLVRA